VRRPGTPADLGEKLAPALRDIRAVVFDTDGVITDSARVHAAAWKTAFDAFLRAHPPDDPAQRRPFDARDDYLRHVDGKSRLDGAAAFLASRGLDTSDDTPVVAVAGRCTVDPERLRAHGVAAVYPLTDLEPDPARSMAHAAGLLETTAGRIAADWLREPERTP